MYAMVFCDSGASSGLPYQMLVMPWRGKNFGTVSSRKRLCSASSLPSAAV
jgi:hypothetical protein